MTAAKNPMCHPPKHAIFSEPVLLGIVLLASLCASVQSIASLVAGVYGVREEVATVIFFLANFTLAAIIPKPEMSAIDAEGRPRKLRLVDWVILSYFFTIGLGFTWACAFLWLSRRHAFFTTSVIAATGLIMASYVAIALLVAWFTGRNWRMALLVIALAPFVVASTVLRLNLIH